MALYKYANDIAASVCRQNLLDKLATELREDLVHLGLGSGCEWMMQPASKLDGFQLDVLPP